MKKKYFDYIVYEDGRVYSNKTNKFLKGEITRIGYLQYTLSLNGKPTRIRCHRLVAELFLEKSNKEHNIVNHIDGDKLNNHYTNLEWCDYEYNNRHAREKGLNNVSKSNSRRWENDEFRKKTSEKMSRTLKERGTYKGSKNPRFRYSIRHKGIEIDRKTLSELIGKSQSYTDKAIRESSSGIKIDIFEKLEIKIVDTKKS